MTTSEPLDGNPTIVLIHGLWMTPRSWEHWIEHYRSRGYRVLAPAYPGLEVEVEALREDPSPIEALSVPDTVAHLEGIIRGLDRPPFIMGHSFGGVLTQILLDHGLGAAGVAIDSVPAEGIRTLPASQIRATFPVLDNPANRHTSMGHIYRDYLAAWKAEGCGVFCHFLDVYTPGKHGNWGALERQDQDVGTAHKYRALVDTAAQWSSSP